MSNLIQRFYQGEDANGNADDLNSSTFSSNSQANKNDIWSAHILHNFNDMSRQVYTNIMQGNH